MDHDNNNGSILRRETTNEHGSWYYHKMGSSTDLSTSIVLAFSDVLGEDVEQLHPPLQDTINPDALNTIFNTPDTSTMVSAASVKMHLWGHDITIHNDGWIVISPKQEENPE